MTIPREEITKGCEQKMQFDRYCLMLAATIGLGLAAPVPAQETQAPTSDAEAPPPEAPAAVVPAPGAPDAPAAEAPGDGAGETAAAPGADAPTDGDPAAPEITEVVRDTFGDWQVRCGAQGSDCFMYQLALDSGKNPVAEVSLLKLPENSEAVAGVTVVSPLGTLLTSGVVVQIDANEARQYPFNWCSQVGCFSRFGLTQQSVAAMKRGKAGKMTLISVAAPQNPIGLNLSLTGFTDAFDSLETPTAPAAVSAPAPTPELPSLAPKAAPTLAPVVPAN